MRQAWRWLLDGMDHNQNGIGGEAADDDKRRLKTTAEDTARLYADSIARRLAARATAPHAHAFPLVVFNPLGWTRSGPVRGRVALYGDTFATFHKGFRTSAEFYDTAPGPVPTAFRLVDATGKETAFHLEAHRMMVADTLEFTFFAEDVPAFGAKTYYVEPEKPASAVVPFTLRDDRDEDRRHADRHAGAHVLENEWFRLEAHRVTGGVSLHDKRADRLLLDGAGVVGREEKRGEYIFDMALSGRVMPAVIDAVDFVAANAVYARLRIRGSVYAQPFEQTVTLWARAPLVEWENRVSWEGGRYVRLEQVFPFAAEWKPAIRYGVPFGQVRYPETVFTRAPGLAPENQAEHPAAAMRLARDWVHIGDARGGLTIGADHRQWTFGDATLRAAMVRGIGWTSGGALLSEQGEQTGVERPPKGEYTFRYRLTPDAAGATPTGRVGWEMNAPLWSVPVAHGHVSDEPGVPLPALPDSADTGVLLVNLKPGESAATVAFRAFEGCGAEAELSLPPCPGWTWQETDLAEEHPRPIPGNRARFRPFEIKTLLLRREPESSPRSSRNSPCRCRGRKSMRTS